MTQRSRGQQTGWRRRLLDEVKAAGGTFVRTTQHGDLYNVLGQRILIGRDQSGGGLRERGNAEGDWRRIKRGLRARYSVIPRGKGNGNGPEAAE